MKVYVLYNGPEIRSVTASITKVNKWFALNNRNTYNVFELEDFDPYEHIDLNEAVDLAIGSGIVVRRIHE